MFCVGNGFIRSERLMNIRGSLRGIWGSGTDKSVPYEKNQHFSIQHTLIKTLPSGMHKCIPYELFVKEQLS